MSELHPSEKYQSINIPKESPLQDYMVHQSVARRTTICGISLGGKLEGMFVENQITVNDREEASIEARTMGLLSIGII